MPFQVRMVSWFDEHWYHVEYEGNGQKVDDWFPSVTTKLGIIDKPFLAKWRGDVGNREAARIVLESQERGSRIHNAWNVFCMGGTVIYNPRRHPTYGRDELEELIEQIGDNHVIVDNQDEMLALIKLQKVVEIIKPRMLFSERVLYSLKNKDAGTADNGWFIKEGKYPVNGKTPLYIPEGRYILDLKTGNQVSDEAGYQTAAYVKCAEGMGDEPYTGTIILHTNAKTKFGIEGMACILSLRPEVEENYLTYRVASDLWVRKNKEAAPRILEFPSIIKLPEDYHELH